MQWGKREIEKHTKAAMLLDGIKNKAFDYIRDKGRVTEYEVQQLIHGEFKKSKLVTTDPQIVAFQSSAATPHYFPPKKGSKKLRENNFILIDIWARLRDRKAPYGDITWMGFRGKTLKGEMKKVYGIVISARDESLDFVRKEVKKGKMPIGCEVDKVARDLISRHGYGKKFIHTLGHGLGTASPHWSGGNLRRTNKNPLVKNIGYTIEPGIYLKGRFGVRSEMDFYVDKDGRVVLTSPVQRRIVRV